jgi:hypothetical protein
VTEIQNVTQAASLRDGVSRGVADCRLRPEENIWIDIALQRKSCAEALSQIGEINARAHAENRGAGLGDGVEQMIRRFRE